VSSNKETVRSLVGRLGGKRNGVHANIDAVACAGEATIEVQEPFIPANTSKGTFGSNKITGSDCLRLGGLKYSRV
jgi:hypothetical protein